MTTTCLRRVKDADGAVQCEALMAEYGEWLRVRFNEDFGASFTAQDAGAAHAGFAAEFPKLFGPSGRLYLAEVNGEPAGVAALKPIDADTAELKRMYVRPEYRGLGIARTLLNQIIADARLIGYRTVRLDTLSFMTAAHALYRSFGFVDCPAFDGAEGAALGFATCNMYMELWL